MESATTRATKRIAEVEKAADNFGGCDRLAAKCHECGGLKSLVYTLAGELDAKNLPMTDDDSKFVEHIYDQISAYQSALSRRNLGDAGKTATQAMQIALDGLGDLLDELANPTQKARTQEDAAWDRVAELQS